MTPPWLWLYVLGYVLQGIPEYVSELRYQIAEYTGHGGISPQVTAQMPFTLLRVFAIVAVMPPLLLAVGALACAFPHVRGRWVEWRLGLACDGRAVITEMQRFVDERAPSIRLRVTLRADQMARIYPVGWRTARIAVFRPLPALWHDDRQAAEAILLHEIAHLRQGDQLAVGLGSPFIWLIRIWVPTFVLLVLGPLAIYFGSGGGALAHAVSGQVALQALQIPRVLIVPVASLWLAELGADQLTAQATGPGPLQRALRATARPHASPAARAFALLSHPPQRLRLAMAAPHPATTLALLAGWPTALIAQLCVTCLAAVPAYLLIGYSLAEVGSALLGGIHEFLSDSRILITAATVLLLAWPLLARPWERLWSPGPRPARRQPLWPYLAAATLPAGMLVLSFASLQGSHTGGRPSAALLRAKLITSAELPAGYQPYRVQNDEPTGSNEPRCLQALNDLELNPLTEPGSTQVEIAYAQSQTGPWLQEILRSYPEDAVHAMENIGATLAGCRSFSVSWTTPPAASATETVRVLGPIGLGDQSWSATITVRGTEVTTGENLDIVRVGTSLIVLSHAGSPSAPPVTETKMIASVATARLQALERQTANRTEADAPVL
jgi:Zn-dependent protease with chaperone function